MRSGIRRFTFAPSRRLGVTLAVVAFVGALGAPWAAATTSSGDRAIFEPLPPVRIFDTRSPANPVGPGESRLLQITGAGGVPADATAVVVNVTAVSPTAAGWLTLYPSDAASVPVVSNVNFSPGQVVPNAATVPLGATGAIRIFNQAGQTHVLVDVAGYYRGHTHDDRYYLKAQAQARTAVNSLTCPAGQLLRSVAPDGAPTCASPAPAVTRIAGPIGSVPASDGFVLATTRATITTTAGQTVVASFSGVLAAAATTQVRVDICYSTGGGPLVRFTGPDHLLLILDAGDTEMVSSTLSIQLPAGTHAVGLCLDALTADLVYNDYVHGTVTVFG